MERKNLSTMNLVQTIFEHVLESFEPIRVSGHQLRKEMSFNKLKGETLNGELNRWLKWIREVKCIGHEYDLERDEYIFQLNFR